MWLLSCGNPFLQINNKTNPLAAIKILFCIYLFICLFTQITNSKNPIAHITIENVNKNTTQEVECKFVVIFNKLLINNIKLTSLLYLFEQKIKFSFKIENKSSILLFTFPLKRSTPTNHIPKYFNTNTQFQATMLKQYWTFTWHKCS